MILDRRPRPAVTPIQDHQNWADGTSTGGSARTCLFGAGLSVANDG
jgi:hypothetical protein